MEKDALLMKNNIPVLRFNLDENTYEVLSEKHLPIQLIGAIKPLPDLIGTTDDELQAYLKTVNNITVSNAVAATHYLASRILNLSRENAKKILNAFNYSQGQDDLTKARIAVACRAVSVVDNYWIKHVDSEVLWEDVDPRITPLNEIVAHIALSGSSLTLTGNPHTPELTGHGAYAKAWKREDGELWMYKKSSKGGDESKREVMVSKILDCTNVPHVQYELVDDNTCKCRNMTSERLSIVSAEDIFTWKNRTGENFLDYVLSIDAENIYKMCIIDYLTGNSDRHISNWGFYVDNDTNEIVCLHLIFDHNNGFDKELLLDKTGGASKIFEGKTQKEAALYAIKKCDFRITKDITRDMFPSELAYKTFIERAEELGLCQRIERTGLKRLFTKGPSIKFVLQPDNKELYYENIKNFLDGKREPKVKDIDARDIYKR